MTLRRRLTSRLTPRDSNAPARRRFAKSSHPHRPHRTGRVQRSVATRVVHRADPGAAIQRAPAAELSFARAMLLGGGAAGAGVVPGWSGAGFDAARSTDPVAASALQCPRVRRRRPRPDIRRSRPANRHRDDNFAPAYWRGECSHRGPGWPGRRADERGRDPRRPADDRGIHTPLCRCSHWSCRRARAGGDGRRPRRGRCAGRRSGRDSSGAGRIAGRNPVVARLPGRRLAGCASSDRRGRLPVVAIGRGS